MKVQLITICLLAALTAVGQNGDKPGEEQKLLVPENLIPPAPVLSPDEALKSFTLKPGFHMEIVAAEPLVNSPVAMRFDADGRIWVVEMKGYMPDPDGHGEGTGQGTIAVLEDTDGDGRMDKRTVFLDHLVMPRAIGFAGGGVLIAEMPNLWFCKDTNGDLKCDEKTAIATDYVQGDIKNPEHNANGLMRAMDNWVYSANYTTRFRPVDGKWLREPTTFRGQWGLSQDDFGRLVYDSNSDQLRIDLIPSEYLLRNPNYQGHAGIDVDPVGSQVTYPGRVNPGVNRGYQKGVLKPDGRLARFTAACGPVIYRGDNFPAEFEGNAFVCEPSANLIKRNVLKEKDGVVSGHFAYPDSEFITSSDERFRPVNACNGPDGALYLVDLYRGLIQHRIYLTSYLRHQIESRGLQSPVNLGRIYRVVYDGKPLNHAPKLSQASSAELVKALEHPNGWVRDTAQRLLVERGDSTVASDLKEEVQNNTGTVARVQSLWTLEGLGQANAGILRAALGSSETKLQVAALRIIDKHAGLRAATQADVLGLVPNANPELAWQLAFSLGNFDSPDSLAALTSIGGRFAGNRYLRDAILSSVGGRELEYLTALLAKPSADESESDLIHALGLAIIKEGKPDRVNQFFALAAEQSKIADWRAQAMLSGAAANLPRKQRGRPSPKVKSIALSAEPAGLLELSASNNEKTKDLVAALDPMFTWPGKAQDNSNEVRPLTADEQKLYDQGKELFAISCAACHQPHGNGQEGLAPPLAGSEWVLGSEQRPIRIALFGLMGPITVKDKKWELIMPGLGIFSDEQIASILTYIRREWGNTADPVKPETVKAVRDKYPNREDLWTEPELLRIQ